MAIVVSDLLSYVQALRANGNVDNESVCKLVNEAFSTDEIIEAWKVLRTEALSVFGKLYSYPPQSRHKPEIALNDIMSVFAKADEDGDDLPQFCSADPLRFVELGKKNVSGTTLNQLINRITALERSNEDLAGSYEAVSADIVALKKDGRVVKKQVDENTDCIRTANGNADLQVRGPGQSSTSTSTRSRRRTTVETTVEAPEARQEHDHVQLVTVQSGDESEDGFIVQQNRRRRQVQNRAEQVRKTVTGSGQDTDMIAGVARKKRRTALYIGRLSSTIMEKDVERFFQGKSVETYGVRCVKNVPNMLKAFRVVIDEDNLEKVMAEDGSFFPNNIESHVWDHSIPRKQKQQQPLVNQVTDANEDAQSSEQPPQNENEDGETENGANGTHRDG
jgi:hypothetical protein